MPLTCGVGREDRNMASFLDTWIDLESREGTIEGLCSYWILGRNATAKAPRWSIGKDVFHWTR